MIVRGHGLMNLPGPLMLAIMGVLWRAECRVQFMAIHRSICQSYKPVAITTTSATLGRMIASGYVTRHRPGIYQAAISRAALIQAIAAIIEEA
jgi:hypothetical protein